MVCFFHGVAQAQAPTSPNDTDRANALLKQMTTEEKIGQLNQPFYLTLPIPGMKVDPVPYEERVRRGEVGSFLFLTDPKEINRLQKIAMTEQRLHIPILFGFDVIHGFDTEFPVPLAMAASWDPAHGRTSARDRRRGGGPRRCALELRTDVGHCQRPALGTHLRGSR